MIPKVVFCWSDISGYMAACWRALCAYPDLDVIVLAFQARTETAFADCIMHGISNRLLDQRERTDAALVRRLVVEQSPDVVVITGWFHRSYRSLAAAGELRNASFIMGMDTPWRGDLRQRVARWALQRYFRRMEAVVVAGERSWQYAQRLGFAPKPIARGLYGVDSHAWTSVAEQRRQGSWPRRFLFVGRYATIKAVDIMTAAYQTYRNQVVAPWPLVCCGQGELAGLLLQPGIEDHGFVQPPDMADEWQHAGAFLLPSRYDPWPLALVEAAAAGLPIVCTDACGSAVEVVRDGYNGYVVPENNIEALADAMVRIHRAYDDLPTWGERSQQLAAPYSAELWAQRWRALILRVHQARTAKEPA